MSNTLKGRITFGQGIPGPVGPQGPPGKDGNVKWADLTEGQKEQLKIELKGNPGPRGDRGPEGPMGPQGIPGTVKFEDLKPTQVAQLKGERGERGIPGPEGQRGPQGLKGAQGDVGPQGERGLTGPQGPKGDLGTLVYRHYKITDKDYSEWVKAAEGRYNWLFDNFTEQGWNELLIGDTIIITGTAHDRPDLNLSLIGVIKAKTKPDPNTYNAATIDVDGKALATYYKKKPTDYYNKTESDSRYVKIRESTKVVDDADLFIDTEQINSFAQTNSATKNLPKKDDGKAELDDKAKEGILITLASPDNPSAAFQYYYCIGTSGGKVDDPTNKYNGRTWSRSYRLDWSQAGQENVHIWTPWKKLTNSDEVYSRAKTDQKINEFLEPVIARVDANEVHVDYLTQHVDELDAEFTRDIAVAQDLAQRAHNSATSLRDLVKSDYATKNERQKGDEAIQADLDFKYKQLQAADTKLTEAIDPLSDKMNQFDELIKRWTNGMAADDPNTYIEEADGITGQQPLPKTLKASHYPPGWGPGLLINYYTDHEAGTGTQEWTSNANGNVYTRTVTNMKKKNGAVPSFGDWELLLTNKDVYSNEEIDEMFKNHKTDLSDYYNKAGTNAEIDKRIEAAKVDNKDKVMLAPELTFALDNVDNANKNSYYRTTAGTQNLPSVYKNDDKIGVLENVIHSNMAQGGNCDYRTQTWQSIKDNGTFVRTKDCNGWTDWKETVTKGVNQIDNANTWVTTGYIKTRGDGVPSKQPTTNLPDVLNDKSRWGILFFISENTGTGTQFYYPIDGNKKGKTFTRSGVIRDGITQWTGWHEVLTDETGVVNRKWNDGPFPNADNWKTDGYVRTNESTSGLPNWTASEEVISKVGTLQYISTSDTEGYQLFNSVKGQDRYKFGTYKRIWDGSNWSQWQKLMTYEQATSLFEFQDAFGFKDYNPTIQRGYYKMPKGFIIEWHELVVNGNAECHIDWCKYPMSWFITPVFKDQWNFPVIQSAMTERSGVKYLDIRSNKNEPIIYKVIILGKY